MKASDFFVRKHDPELGLCFVLMPFDESLTAVYEHGIKPQIESMGLKCKRADELYTSQNVLGDFWDSLQKAEIIIADCTKKNPNVMYELGLCHALWKKVILLSQDKDDVPFDLRAWRVIWYEFSFAGAARLKEEINRAVSALQNEEVKESCFVPWSSVSSPANRAQLAQLVDEQEWRTGVIEAWKADRQFGFIRAGDESFWFNRPYLFMQDVEIKEGIPVIFKPLEPMPNTTNRRASDILLEGTLLNGVVISNFNEKGFGFAYVEGSEGGAASIYIETRGIDGLQKGSSVLFTISHNKRGPCGINVTEVK